MDRTIVLEPLSAQTLLDYFRFAASSGKAELLVSKISGTWVPLSAEDFGERTQGLALGLALLGVDRDDRVAILSENRPEWPMTDFATLALGALSVPIYTSYLAPQVEYILRDSLAKVVVVSSAVELQKVVDVRDRCPELKHVIRVDRDFDDPLPPGVDRHVNHLVRRAGFRQKDEIAWRQSARRDGPGP